MKKLFLANVPYYDCTEEELKEFFEDRHPKRYGTINSVSLVKAKSDESGKPKNKVSLSVN